MVALEGGEDGIETLTPETARWRDSKRSGDKSAETMSSKLGQIPDEKAKRIVCKIGAMAARFYRRQNCGIRGPSGEVEVNVTAVEQAIVRLRRARRSCQTILSIHDSSSGQTNGLEVENWKEEKYAARHARRWARQNMKKL